MDVPNRVDVRGYLCPQCMQIIITEKEHEPSCPVLTNVWEVQEDDPTFCGVCKRYLVGQYRVIPLMIYPDTDGELESSIGIERASIPSPVCMPCAGLRAASSTPDVQSPADDTEGLQKYLHDQLAVAMSKPISIKKSPEVQTYLDGLGHGPFIPYWLINESPNIADEIRIASERVMDSQYEPGIEYMSPQEWEAKSNDD